MVESETVVGQISTVMDHTPDNLPSEDFMDVNLSASNTAALASSCPPVTSVSADAVVEGMDSKADNSVVVPSSASQEASALLDEETGHLSHSSATEATVLSFSASQTVVYDASANGTAATDTNGDVTALQQSEYGADSTLSAEEERLWSIVKANSLDFNSWTLLIEETEKMAQENVLKIRKVYDAFLAEFPLCYGYWKKYADHETRFGAIDKVVEVYERAVQGVTYSVDIWLHYCTFAINTYGDPDTIRRLFERSLAYVGTDYLSFALWDKYIEYEYTQQEWGRLAMIYTRILENPNQHLDRYFTSFKELAGSQPLAFLRRAEEAASTSAARNDSNADVQDSEINHTDAQNESDKPTDAGPTEAEELEKYISTRDEIYRKAKEFDSKIIGFETAIRRPYFHVRPLSDTELENWHSYLDFIEGEGELNKIVKLYERCLVACANYSEFWIRYILYMEGCGNMDLADNALARATQVFVKRQPEIHLFGAHVKEQRGDVLGARAAYQLVHTEISPGLLEAIVNHANMERRLGNMQDAFSLYEQAIAIEKGKEQSQTLPLLFAQYSRFVYLAYGNAEKAWDILIGALDDVQFSKPLLEALIHLESIHLRPKRTEYIDSLVEKYLILAADTDAASMFEREELSNIFLEFLDLFGDVQSIKKAKVRHARLFLRHRSSSVSRKRHADDFLTSDKAKMEKSFTVTPSTAATGVAAYPTAQNQWAPGYGAQPWPQATQTPASQYCAAYPQQAAYSGYYGSNYAPQPVGAPAPPPPAATTYGAYPSTYPAQAYPQQAFVAPVAAPAAATTAPAAQQPAAAPQTYYGGYY